MSDYSLTLERLRAGLMDAAAAVWKDSELDEALRQSLADMSLAAGTLCTLNGLDGAETTSLPAGHLATVVRGAAAYALLWRAAERVDAFSLRPNLTAEALAAAAALMNRFEVSLAHLASLRTAGLHTAENTPFPTGSDELQPGWQLPEGNHV